MMQIESQSLITTQPFFRATLPLPPGVNTSYQIVQNESKETGKRYRHIAHTKEAQQFKKDAALMLTESKCDLAILSALKSSRYKTPLSMAIRFYFPTLWKRDIDGGEKAVIDEVFRHLALNDVLVVDKHTTKEVDVLDPRVEVEISCVVPCNG